MLDLFEIIETQEKGKNCVVILPTKNSPRLIIPINNFNYYKNGLKIHNVLSIKHKIYKKLLLVAYFFKFLKLINVYYFSEKTTDFLKYIRNKLSLDELIFSVYVSSNKKFLKYVLMFYNNSGQLGIAKIASNEASLKLILREKGNLRFLEKKTLNFHYPQVLFDIETEYFKGVFQSNIMPESYKSGSKLTKQIVESSIEISKLKLTRKNNLELEKLFYDCINIIGLSKDKELLLERDLKILLSNEFPFVFVHGDFVGYNLGMKGKDLFIYDWEYAHDGGFPLFDLFHFIFQGRSVTNHKFNILSVFSEQNINYYKFYLDNIGVRNYNIIKSLFVFYLFEKIVFEHSVNGEFLHFVKAIKKLISKR